MKKRRISYKVLYNYYITKDLIITEIAKKLKSSPSTISRELKRHNLFMSASEKRKTHGMSNTRQYGIWQQMKNRCNNPKNIKYHIYGGKGITYCDKWENFEGFWKDMKEGYSDNLTLDRINNNGNYNKDNCRWATYTQQNNNRKNNVQIDKSVSELINITGLSQSAIYRRIRKGWSEEKIINTPKLTKNGKEK